jgi:microcin C transport system ATP-binding protein
MSATTPDARSADAASGAAAPLLSVENLRVDFATAGASARVVEDVSFSIAPGERFALVGESGSGKTVTAYSLLRLHSDARYGGRILFDGRNLLSLSEREMRGVRGRDIAMVFQEPMSALNPLYSIGDQICETIELHEGLPRAQAAERALRLLERVRIAEPRRRFASLPHQLSGGQRQRAMIAMALACHPRLLVADEPTTALDVTLQRQIVELLAELQREMGMAVLLITHDLPLVRSFADRVAVMQSGRLVETAGARGLRCAAAPLHAQAGRQPPRRDLTPVPDSAPVLLRASGLGCRFESRTGWFSRHIFEAVQEWGCSWRAARRWASSASPGLARPRWGWRCCGCRRPAPRARSNWAACGSTRWTGAGCGRCAGACRSSSRTPTTRCRRA